MARADNLEALFVDELHRMSFDADADKRVLSSQPIASPAMFQRSADRRARRARVNRAPKKAFD